MSTTSQVNIIQKREIASDTIELSLTRPSGFVFKAGQYIQLGVPKLLHPDPRGTSRVFSIASSPEESDVLRIAFRNTGSGYKKTLSEMDVGTEVELEGPLGHFTLPQGIGGVKHTLIAGGIGITPFMSMIRSVLSSELKEQLVLVYANRDEKSAAYLSELEDMDKLHPHFSLKTIFGRVTSEHVGDLVNNTASMMWWVVGPPSMVAEVNNILVSFGVDTSSIRHEEFTGY